MISNDLSSHLFFLLFGQVCNWRLLLKSSVQSIYSSTPEFLLLGCFLMVFISLLNFSFCLCTVFLVSFTYFFFFNSWVKFFKRIILNSLPDSSQISFFRVNHWALNQILPPGPSPQGDPWYTSTRLAHLLTTLGTTPVCPTAPAVNLPTDTTWYVTWKLWMGGLVKDFACWSMFKDEKRCPFPQKCKPQGSRTIRETWRHQRWATTPGTGLSICPTTLGHLSLTHPGSRLAHLELDSMH